MARLTNDKRQKNQLVLAFLEESRSEAPTASGEGTESLEAKRRSENPAIGDRVPVAQPAESPYTDPYVR